MFRNTIYMMKDNQSSITAAGIAVARAVESEKPQGERICYDPWAARLLNPLFYRFMRFFIVTGYTDRSGPGVTGFLVARCRYMDDILLECIENGMQQLVVLGAGYDSRAYRITQLKNGVRVFELDHPATQKQKIEKVKSILGNLPEHVTYVAIDFTAQSLGDRLIESGYDEHQKTLFIWEGVVMYLSLPAVEDTLGFIVNHSAPGSQVVFDYIYTALLNGSVTHGEIKRMRRARPISGEGLTFSIAEGTAQVFLEGQGFNKVKDIPSGELHKRYFTGANASRKVTWGYGIIVGEVK